jgi:hypothetical protein
LLAEGVKVSVSLVCAVIAAVVDRVRSVALQ